MADNPTPKPTSVPTPDVLVARRKLKNRLRKQRRRVKISSKPLPLNLQLGGENPFDLPELPTGNMVTESLRISRQNAVIAAETAALMELKRLRRNNRLTPQMYKRTKVYEKIFTLPDSVPDDDATNTRPKNQSAASSKPKSEQTRDRTLGRRSLFLKMRAKAREAFFTTQANQMVTIGGDSYLRDEYGPPRRRDYDLSYAHEYERPRNVYETPQSWYPDVPRDSMSGYKMPPHERSYEVYQPPEQRAHTSSGDHLRHPYDQPAADMQAAEEEYVARARAHFRAAHEQPVDTANYWAPPPTPEPQWQYPLPPASSSSMAYGASWGQPPQAPWDPRW